MRIMLVCLSVCLFVCLFVYVCVCKSPVYIILYMFSSQKDVYINYTVEPLSWTQLISNCRVHTYFVNSPLGWSVVHSNALHFLQAPDGMGEGVLLLGAVRSRLAHAGGDIS